MEPRAVPVGRFQHGHIQNHIRRHLCPMLARPSPLIRIEKHAPPPCSNTAKTSACCLWYSSNAYCYSSDDNTLASHTQAIPSTAYVSTTPKMSLSPGNRGARVACPTFNAAGMARSHSMLWNRRNCNNTSRDHIACRSCVCPDVGKYSRPSIEVGSWQVDRSRRFRRCDRTDAFLRWLPGQSIVLGPATLRRHSFTCCLDPH
ncbi:hypothetical protein LY78DRAFT_297637 [Colletotrichum sublineola]|nr:hypothetical protein LY78DRAFT_297637 [Colletotrichum sublineola]